MNIAVRTRLYQFVKNINCQNLYHGQNEPIFKLRNCSEYLIIKKSYTTPIRELLRKNPAKSKVKPRKDDIGFTGYLLLGIPLSTFCLGVWQIQRLQWKNALVDSLMKRTTMEPVELPLDLTELESMEYCPVKVRGRFLHDKEFIIGPKSLIVKGAGVSEGSGGILTAGSSQTGYCVVTPFQLEGRDLTILVNRGWVPHTYKKNRKEAQTQSNDVVTLTGLVRLTEHRPQFIVKNSPSTGNWLYRDLEAMSEMAGTAPVYIDLIANETVRGGPIAGQTRVVLRNEHVSYIFTWFSLSIITAFMWHRQFIRKLALM